MKKGRANFNLLFNINVGFAFNKKSIISLVCSFIILTSYLIFISYMSYDKNYYLLAFNDIHNVYLKEGIFVVNIINSLLILVLITILFVNCDSFDSMYVSYIPRNIVSKCKILSIIYLEIFICVFEFFILMIPAIIIYPHFKLEVEHIYIFIYIIIFGLFQISTSLLLISFICNNFIPMLCFLINFMLQILSLGFADKIEYLKYLIPTTYINYNVPMIGICIIFIGFMIYKMKYIIKNIN